MTEALGASASSRIVLSDLTQLLPKVFPILTNKCQVGLNNSFGLNLSGQIWRYWQKFQTALEVILIEGFDSFFDRCDYWLGS